MSDSQLWVAPSFVAMYVRPGKVKPDLDAASLYQRYEHCEDLSQLLVDMAGQMQANLGIDASDVLARVGIGLAQPGPASLPAAEQRWVLCRLAELMGWPLPAWPEAGQAVLSA